MLFDSMGVIGRGFVGEAQYRVWIEHVKEMRAYDLVKERCTHTLVETSKSEVVFLCLPTPMVDAEAGKFNPDLTTIRGVLEQLDEINCRSLIVIKSTVPVGFTEESQLKHPNLSICHSPEFLTARCHVADAHTPSRNIVGHTSGNKNAAAFFRDKLRVRFPGVPGFLFTSGESELVKLACNAFFSMKVNYFNSIYNFAKMAKLDWDRVTMGMLTDGRIAHAHTKVPGPDGRQGFGGTCLPKDLANFIDCIERLNLNPGVLQAVFDSNLLQRGGVTNF